MDFSSEKIAKEIENLSLMLVIADESDTSALSEVLAAMESVNKITHEENFPSYFIEQISALIDEVKVAADNLKFVALKKLASNAQSLINNLQNSDERENFNLLETKENDMIVDNASANLTEKTDLVEDSRSNNHVIIVQNFYDTHKSLMNELVEKFEAIQAMPSQTKQMPKDLHQDFESYILRLNQDATELSCKPLSEIAQSIFTLLMQYELVDIKNEFQILGDFVLKAIENIKNNQDNPKVEITTEIEVVLKAIEEKLAGTFKSETKDNTEIKNNIELNVVSQQVESKELGTYVIEADNDILSEFVAEAQDHLNAVEGVLLERELDFSPEDVDTLFRGVHSLKGTSSYFNLLEINESSHLLENILDEVRKGTRVLDLNLKGLVLRYVDIQNTLLKTAQAAVSNGGVVKRSEIVLKFINDIEDFFNNKYVPVNNYSNIEEKEEIITELNVVEDIKEEILDKQESVSVSKDNTYAKSFVKIDTERLDSLGEMIGEMVIYSSMLIRRCRTMSPGDESIMRMSDQVEKFSRELQDIGMSMRLDPIRGLFQKLSRLVWDTSKKLGKEVKFVVKGEDTELDRNVIERLADPLMHMVRNSLDHGIEDPETRRSIGKDKVGTVELSSSHEGGSIVVKIKDDGRGLDPEKLFNKAVEKGIISKGANLTEQEIFQLIFAPGFSTAEKVTGISGRGVGMDVVRTNIEAMRGRIQIESKLGQGSVFTIELPLTLAIIEGIEAAVGSEKFIFPMLSVVELIKPTPNMIASSFQVDETFLFRGKHLPLFRLSNIFSVPSKLSSSTEGRVIVLNNGGELVAILVDEIGGNCQTVIKNLGPLFQKQSGIAGCAIVNNGDIGLIIDVRSLVQVAKSESTIKESTRANTIS